MLTQNFMTADQLQITEAEHRALVLTLGAFERGEIAQEHFDMKDWENHYDCGTVRCIGGWASYLYLGHSVFKSLRTNHNSPLSKLFFPQFDDDCQKAYKANIGQAANALRNYLTVGEPRWQEVMST